MAESGITAVTCRECVAQGVKPPVTVSDPFSPDGIEAMKGHLAVHMEVLVGIDISADGKTATFGFGGN